MIRQLVDSNGAETRSTRESVWASGECREALENSPFASQGWGRSRAGEIRAGFGKSEGLWKFAGV